MKQLEEPKRGLTDKEKFEGYLREQNLFFINGWAFDMVWQFIESLIQQREIEAKITENEYWYKEISKRKLISTDFYNRISNLKEMEKKI